MITKTALAERLAYRGDFALGTLMRFLPIVTQIFLWWAIFQSLNPRDPNSAHLAGYSFRDMVAYYLLTMVGRAFSSMPGLSSSIAAKIRDGEIKRFLIQPIDLLTFLFWSRVAHKLAYYVIALLPFVFVFFLCRNFFQEGIPDAATCVCFAISLILSFVLGFYLEACIGLIAFWMLEVSSLLFVYMLLQFFFVGAHVPARSIATTVPAIGRIFAHQVPRLFSGSCLLGEDSRQRFSNRYGDARWLDGIFLFPLSLDLLAGR